jgi:hypothetical protein
VTWEWAGGRLDLVPGRVLQVSLHGQDAFWTAPDVTGWNVGGDRLWLGPERDWFWAGDDPADLGKHVVPPEIDPGEWRTVRSEMGHASYAAAPLLRHRRTGEETQVHIGRDVRLDYADSTRVVYSVHTRVEIAAGPPGQEVSAWSVLQVPAGGVLAIGLSGTWGFRDYLRPFNGSRFDVHDGHAEAKLTGVFMSKIGVRPDVFSGQVRYVRDGLMVERQVDVQPARRYCDHPLGADTAAQGDALQVFEDDGHYGGYAEIEHHSPAVRYGESVVDVCRTTVTLGY